MNKWFKALSKTRKQVAASFSRLVGLSSRVDDAALDELEETLMRADLPVALSMDLVEGLREDGVSRGETGVSFLRRRLREELGEVEDYVFAADARPTTILMLGINGSGKTTTSAKLAMLAKARGLKTVLGAGDTFRAAGSSQLKLWGERIGCDVVTGAMGADAAAVAFDTMEAALARDADVVIIDTAGRMHTKAPLMDELEKVCRAVSKRVPGAPHETWIVLDASMGQNAINQARSFHERVPLTGVVVSKLDGSSKAGFIFSVKQELGVPVRYVGLGEGEHDLEPFDPDAYVDGLLGIDREADLVPVKE